MLNRIGALVTLALATTPAFALECPDGTCTALPGQDQFFCNHCPGTFCNDFFCKGPRCKLDCSKSPPPPSPSPPSQTVAEAAGFLKLTHTAFVQAEKEFANRGNCRDEYGDGADQAHEGGDDAGEMYFSAYEMERQADNDGSGDLYFLDGSKHLEDEGFVAEAEAEPELVDESSRQQELDESAGVPCFLIMRFLKSIKAKGTKSKNGYRYGYGLTGDR